MRREERSGVKAGTDPNTSMVTTTVMPTALPALEDLLCLPQVARRCTGGQPHR